MIGLGELLRYVYGAWRLLRLDPDGIQLFPNTPEAFWRSFQAAVVVLPLYLPVLIGRLSEISTKRGPTEVALAEALFYVIGWVLFPLVVLYLVEALGRWDKYFRYIAAYNWASVIQMLIVFAIFLLSKTGIFPDGVVAGLSIAVQLVMLAYAGYIARVALEVPIPVAVAIVVLDFLITHLILAIHVYTIGATVPQSV